MLEFIFGILSSIAKIISEWPQRQAEKAGKNYANWRAGRELRKELRARRSRIVESIDQRLRDDKSKS